MDSIFVALFLGTITAINFSVGVYLLYVSSFAVYSWFTIGRKPLMSVREMSEGDSAKIKGEIRRRNSVLDTPMGDDGAVIYKYEAHKAMGAGASKNHLKVEEDREQVDFVVDGGTDGKVLVPNDAMPSLQTGPHNDDDNAVEKTIDGGINPEDFEKSDLLLESSTVRKRQRAFYPSDEVVVYGTARQTPDRDCSMEITQGDATQFFQIASSEDSSSIWVILLFVVTGLVFFFGSLLTGFFTYAYLFS